MTRLFAGTSGWAYKAWQPGFYPEKLPQKQFLRYYANHLTAVEVNYTFRRLLTEKTIDNWLAETPESFRFVLKAHQAITHFRKLKNCEDVVQKFLSAIRPLSSAGRLGPVLFQLPPQMKSAPDVLDAFLAMLPRSLQPAFEFRDKSWFAEETWHVLRSHGAALCVAENEELETPDVKTTDVRYYRFRKPQYSKKERKLLAEKMGREVATGETVYAFFKHEESPESPLWAGELLGAVTPRLAKDDLLRT